MEELGQLMQHCWAEDILERPDFNQIKVQLRKFNRYLHLPQPCWVTGDPKKGPQVGAHPLPAGRAAATSWTTCCRAWSSTPTTWRSWWRSELKPTWRRSARPRLCSTRSCPSEHWGGCPALCAPPHTAGCPGAPHWHPLSAPHWAPPWMPCMAGVAWRGWGHQGPPCCLGQGMLRGDGDPKDPQVPWGWGCLEGLGTPWGPQGPPSDLGLEVFGGIGGPPQDSCVALSA